MIETAESTATPEQDTAAAPPKPRLLDQMRAAIRVKHYSLRTEKTYLAWVKQFIRWSGMRHPADMGAAEIEAFLSMLANQRDVAASTQNQALSALLFLYKHVLGVDLPWMDGITRAKKPARLPVVLSQADDGAVPITLLKQMRELEAQTELEKESINRLERELGSQRPAATPDMAEKWLALIEGVEALDFDARMQARELTRASFARIVIWHAGDPAGDDGVIDMELTARGGGSMRIRIDRATGGLVD